MKLRVATVVFALLASSAHAGDARTSPSGDGFLGLGLEGGVLRVTVLDGRKEPVPVKEGSGTMFLTYLEDGHRSKVDLALEGGAFVVAVPREAHGPTKIVVRLTADGKTHQGTFELTLQG